MNTLIEFIYDIFYIPIFDLVALYLVYAAITIPFMWVKEKFQ